MAVIYAQPERIGEFAQLLEKLPLRLETALCQQEEALSLARKALDLGLAEVEKIHNNARAALDRALDLMQMEKKGDDGPSEQLRRTVARLENACAFAQQQRQRLEQQKDAFEETVARTVTRQELVMENCRELGKKGAAYLSDYTQLLLAADRALLEDNDSGSGSFLAADGSYVQARDMTPEELESLRQKTGWDDGKLKKCKLRPDGSVWFKSNNSTFDSRTYKSAWFERDTVYIGGVRVEGIFPKFDAIYEPSLSLPETLWKGERCDYNAHFAWCRKQLKAAVTGDPALAARFTAQERKLILAEKPLPRYTWHHHQQPGKMQLVSSQQHNTRAGGVNHTGGNALWCNEL